MSRWISRAVKVTVTAALLALLPAVGQGTLGAASSVARTTGDSTWT